MATSPISIQLRHVGVRLPGGRVLFEALNHVFQPGLTGVVGPNGSGKSVLAQLLCAGRQPDSGSIIRHGTVVGVAQQQSTQPAATASQVAGLDQLFAALSRIEDGCGEASDFDLMHGRWSLPADFAQAMRDCGLSQVTPDCNTATLSGGALTRLKLTGAFLSGASWLVLDEPSNHLDQAGRAWLLKLLRSWPGSAIVISHDRELLDAMHNIVEVGGLQLKAYGGNYSLYREQRDCQRAAALAAADHARNERLASLRALRTQHERQQARAARNERVAKHANMPAISRGKHAADAQAHAGREAVRQARTRQALDTALHSARGVVDTPLASTMLLPAAAVRPGQRVLALEQVRAPGCRAAPLDLVVSGPLRIAMTGPNGCGKSTLLRIMAGALQAAAGQARTFLPCAWLDQQTSALLPPQLTVLQSLRHLQSPLADGVLRSHLALLGLGPDQVLTPAANLSGGERLKAALACAVWQAQAAQLLLLDEPTNHLDLPSVLALEQALQAYPGALIAASHDRRFLQALQPTHTLTWQSSGWQFAEA
jgi:ATPase subunit of ABC transporter with duplicated ATPase domains